jgi:hypothetical protein
VGGDSYNKNARALLDNTKVVGLEIRTNLNKYMSIARMEDEIIT